VLAVVAGQAVAAAERERLRTEAAQAESLRRSDALRTAVLAALSHDLRTPLATIKASVSSLRDPRIDWDPGDRRSLLESCEVAVDQLGALLENLLDMSRLQAGAIAPAWQHVSVDEVLHRALIGFDTDRIVDEIPDDLPLLDTDPGLLERVFANLIGNALRHGSADEPVRLLGCAVPPDLVEIRIADRGGGIRAADRDRVFQPFQQLGDVPGDGGLGLGLAVARGLAEAVDATIDADDTPGGGLTMVVRVPTTGRRTTGAVG